MDSLRQVRYWLRNVDSHQTSFRLPLANGGFYPDFVALLEDGRLLVVEYKGAHLWDNADTKEKRTIGLRWEQESKGKGLFIMVGKKAAGKGMREQIKEKIGGR